VEKLQREIENAHAELDAEGVSRSSFAGPFGDIKYEDRTLNLVGRIHILAGPKPCHAALPATPTRSVCCVPHLSGSSHRVPGTCSVTASGTSRERL
jgi:hypothetical protein